MRDAKRHLSEIMQRIEKRGCVLMLDFDGVLSRHVRDPNAANIAPRAMRALSTLVRHTPVAILSGRELNDLQKRVGIKRIMYAGSHGLEWNINGTSHVKKVPERITRGFSDARAALAHVAGMFPGLIVEDKPQAFAVNYRPLNATDTKKFLNTANKALRPYTRVKLVRILDHAYTYEVVAKVGWTKGECALYFYRQTKKKNAVPIYIGDGVSDEDAFRALRSGITIRVIPSRISAAKYFFDSRKEVDEFLERLAEKNVERSVTAEK